MKLSIIIPVLDEAAALGGALAELRGRAPDCEILVVDGGSRDGTAAIARPLSRLLQCSRGRAQQMNHGAAEAGGDWLLFLHADTRLPADFLSALDHARGRGYRAGLFRLRIAGRHPLLPLLAMGANARTRLRGIFLGDQTLFIQKALFHSLGGFPRVPLMEDYEFSLRLRREGIPLYLSHLPVTTSGRRWDKEGFLKTWWLMRRLYHAHRRRGGAPGSTALYHDVR